MLSKSLGLTVNVPNMLSAINIVVCIMTPACL